MLMFVSIMFSVKNTLTLVFPIQDLWDALTSSPIRIREIYQVTFNRRISLSCLKQLSNFSYIYINERKNKNVTCTSDTLEWIDNDSTT